MAFFDIFQEAKVCHADGGIRGNFEEIIEGISCGDRLKQVMLMEEYDDFDAYDLIH